MEKPNRLPDAIQKILATADRFELLSLGPIGWQTREGEHFWGQPVLDTVVVTPAERDELVSALERGIAGNDGYVAACRSARHGIRASAGGSSVDLVVNLRCTQVDVYLDGERAENVLTTDSPRSTFDPVLSAAGVRLAEQ